MAFELSIITDKHRREVWKRAFKMWQKRPHEVAPLPDTQHECATCGTSFQGNYCPRCGQSARVGRFSFKTAFLLFLDVWGIGNRGMFRSIRDLMLRPGYMIRDYISGHQAAYFPPFKMFFLLTTLSLLISHGLGIDMDTEESQPQEDMITVNTDDESAKQWDNEDEDESQEAMADNTEPQKDDKAIEQTDEYKLTESAKQNMFIVPKFLNKFRKKYPGLFGFFTLLLFSAPFYLFIKRCPNIPDLRYSEHLVAMVYTSNMYSIYMIFASLVPSKLLENIIQIIAIVMLFVALHQFSGLSKRRLLLYIFLSFLITIFVVITTVLGVGLLITVFRM